MLQFVSPWRGMRMLWIDAICINQFDLVEREQQVGNMHKIYRDCMRVVVYLGPEVISKSARFPTYRSLDELLFLTPDGAAPGTTRLTNNLTALLEQPYFSRVWMIQELLVSGKAVIRYGNDEYLAVQMLYDA